MHNIVFLPKSEWKDAILPIRYTAHEHYAVKLESKPSGFSVEFTLEPLDEPMYMDPEKYDFPDKLYQDWWADACAWGVVEEGKLLAAIETCPETFSKRLRVTELWIADHLQKQGLGRRLMEIAFEQARREHRRAIILETQSCNVNAIGFYRHMGFALIGFDACCYANNDIARHEMRMELGILLDVPESGEESV